MFSLHKPCFQLLKLVFLSWPLLVEYSYSFFFLALTWGILGEFLVLGEEKCTFKSHSGTCFAEQHIYAQFEYYILYETEVNFL